MTIVNALKKITTTLGGSYTAKDNTISKLLDKINTAFENGGGGGSGGGDIVRVPFTLTVTQEGLSGGTDADFAETLAARSNGKIIVAAATLDFGGGMYQYLDGLMSGADAGGDSVLSSTVFMLSGSGSKYEAYTIKWTASGVEPTKKDIAVS